MMRTNAYQALDCGNKVRVRYHLPRPVTEELLASLELEELRIDAFSRIIQTARDPYRFSRCGLEGVGALGDPWLMISYRGDCLEDCIRGFEDELERVLDAPVHYVREARRAA